MFWRQSMHLIISVRFEPVKPVVNAHFQFNFKCSSVLCCVGCDGPFVRIYMNSLLVILLHLGRSLAVVITHRICSAGLKSSSFYTYVNTRFHFSGSCGNIMRLRRSIWLIRWIMTDSKYRFRSILGNAESLKEISVGWGGDKSEGRKGLDFSAHS